MNTTRRSFLAASSAFAGVSILPAFGANEKVVVAVMGARGKGRGTALAKGFAKQANAEVAYVIDVDSRELPGCADAVGKLQDKAPKTEKDFRKVLEDKDVDALVIGAPDHWHAPAAMAAMKAGKHVYVEKPCSHNAKEGEELIDLAHRSGKIVQHGTQRRSWPGIVEGIQQVHDGAIGKVLSAKTWYFNDRPSIGKGTELAAPDWLDWTLWQGPAPVRKYRSNAVHYHWHWYWHWGTGEIGNNGVHMLDLARWGLQVGLPKRVTSNGGRYRYQDDQETPDVNTAVFDFGDKSISWEGKSWGGKTPTSPGTSCAFYGDKGSLLITGNGYTLHGLDGKEAGQGKGETGDAVHLQNFVDTIRGEAELTAPIREGATSALLCHLGNISYRTNTMVECDVERRRIVRNTQASWYWGRDYEPAFNPFA